MRNAIGATLVSLLTVGVVGAQREDVKTVTDRAKNAFTPITGQCHCGTVAYRVQGAIIKSSYCDCLGCQRATATLKAPFVTVLRSDFTLTAGKPAQFRSDSGVKCDAHGEWNFCPKCGTQLFWKGHKGKELDIFVGTLHDTTVFQPGK